MFRFPLWFLAAVLAVLGVWLADRSHQARLQRRCVFAVQSGGGRVYYDYASCRGGIPAGESPYARLVERLCGEDFLHRVIRVDLPSGADGIDLDELGSVEMVVLHGDDVDDDDVQAVANLPRLKHLKIVAHGRYRGTRITDKSLELIGQLPTVESVALEGRGLSPQGVAALLQAPQLQSARILGMAWNGVHAIEFPPHVRVEFLEHGMPPLWGGLPPADKSLFIVGGETVPHSKSTDGHKVSTISSVRRP